MKLSFQLETDSGNTFSFNLNSPDKDALTYIAKLAKGQIVTPSMFCQVRITRTGEMKINLIRTIREITGLLLKEAKDVAELKGEIGPGVVFKGIPRAQAEVYQKQLEAEGATVIVETVQ